MEAAKAQNWAVEPQEKKLYCSTHTCYTLHPLHPSLVLRPKII
jgi:hypothetical protein